MKKKTLLNRDPNNTTSTSADDPSLCILTFAGRLREAVIETNAALSALISIYAVLQTGITRGLRTRTHFRLKSAVCASRASYHLHQSNMTEIPALVDFDEQNHKKKTTYQVVIGLVLRGGEMRAAHALFQTNTHTKTKVQTENGRLINDLVTLPRGSVDRLPARVNRRFRGACNTSHGSSETRRSAAREEQRERQEKVEC